MFKIFLGDIVETVQAPDVPPPLIPSTLNPYPISRPVLPIPSTTITKTGLAAIDTAVAGDVIAISGATASSFKIENKNFSSPVVIWATDGAKISAGAENLQTVDNSAGAAGIFINNCSNIILKGFQVVGTTVNFGIRVHKSTDITLYNCHVHDVLDCGISFVDCERTGDVDSLVHDVGMCGIDFNIRTDIALDGWFSFRAQIYNTGKRVTDSGYGLYFGSNSNPTYGPVTSLYIEDPYIHNTTAECLNVKSNVEEAIVLRPRCEYGNIKSNGLITIGAENETTQGEIILDGALTRGVTNRLSIFNRRYHVVIGRGNVTVLNCTLDYMDEASSLDYGIGLFRTSVNQTDNDVTIAGSNTFGAIESIKRIEINQNYAGTEVNNPLDYFVPTNDPAVLWLDASDDSTFTETTGVAEWRDKSGNGYHFQQAVEAKRPALNARTINGVKAVSWAGSKFMTLPALTGPQLLKDSMIFAVFDNDSPSVKRWLLSFQEADTQKIGIGNEEASLFFGHCDAVESQVTVASNSGVTLLAGYRSSVNQFIIDHEGSFTTNALAADQRAIDTWVLGCNIASGTDENHFDGAIGEIKVYDYYNNETFYSEISALKEKWGINYMSSTRTTLTTNATTAVHSHVTAGVAGVRFAAKGTFGGGTLTLQERHSDGVFRDIPSASFTSNQSVVIDIPNGSALRGVLAGSTSPSLFVEFSDMAAI